MSFQYEDYYYACKYNVLLGKIMHLNVPNYFFKIF